MMLKRLIKKMAYWTVPPGVQYVAKSLLLPNNQMKIQDRKAVLAKNTALRDLHRDERCFVLATGPSIKELDLTLLKGELCISVSSFYVHPEFAVIQPKYHCVAPLHPPFTEQDGSRWFRHMETFMDHTTIFISYSDKLLVEGFDCFSNNIVYYLGFEGGWASRQNQNLDLDQILPGCISSTLIGLMTALYLGCNPIYLLGVDQEVPLIPTADTIVRRPKHFYDSDAENPLGEESLPDYEGVLSIAVKNFEQYIKLKAVAHSRGIDIYNATEGGKMEIFPRAEYEKIVDLLRC